MAVTVSKSIPLRAEGGPQGSLRGHDASGAAVSSADYALLSECRSVDVGPEPEQFAHARVCERIHTVSMYCPHAQTHRKYTTDCINSCRAIMKTATLSYRLRFIVEGRLYNYVVRRHSH